MPKALIVVAFAATGTFVPIGCSCGATDAQPQPDAASDAGAKADHVTRDVAVEADSQAPTWDGSVINDWPGWRRLTELDPSCVMDVPIDLASVVSPLQWKACASGRTGCTQIDTSSWGSTLQQIMAYAVAAPDGSSLVISRWMDDAQDEFETLAYDTATMKPLAAWRAAFSSYPCDVRIVFAPSNPSVLYRAPLSSSAPAPVKYQHGPFPTLSAAPALTALTPLFQPVQFYQFESASDQVLAFDQGLSPNIVRLNWGDTTYVRSAPSFGYQLSMPTVVGTDVFALNNSGPDGWSREARVDTDGSVSIFRAVTHRNVAGFVYDGAYWYWTEAYGASSPSVDQTTVEIYTAPYTNDPATLEATKSKLLTLPSAMSRAAFPNLYVMNSSVEEVDLVRRSDDAKLAFPAYGGQYCKYPVFASVTEIWCLESVSNNGADGVAFSRTKLPSW